MTREELEQYLAEGHSLQQIGKRVGRSPSTISYHLKKHGLEPVNKQKHASRGGIPRHVLADLQEQGSSLAEIARTVDRSVPTVRYWLERYGLGPTKGGKHREQVRRAREAGLRQVVLECERHGRTDFVVESGGRYRCVRCRTEAVREWRRRAKRRLVAAAGGSCVLCGYDGCPAALQFHHLEPAEKKFSISREGVTRSFAELRAEAAKCVLLCANCHAEVEAGYTTLRQ